MDAPRAGVRACCPGVQHQGPRLQGYVTGTAAGAFVIINLGSVTLGGEAVTPGTTAKPHQPSVNHQLSRRDCSAGLDAGSGSLGVGGGGDGMIRKFPLPAGLNFPNCLMSRYYCIYF